MTKCVSVHSAHRIGNVWIDFNVSTIARLAIVDTLFFGKSLSMHATTCIENLYHNVHLPFDGEFRFDGTRHRTVQQSLRSSEIYTQQMCYPMCTGMTLDKST